MALSTRGDAAAQPGQASHLYDMLRDSWHPTSNPAGYVMLGLAENHLMHDALLRHMHGHFDLPGNACTYGDGFTGSKRLKLAMSRLLNKHLKPAVPITTDHVIITNGCSASVEHLAWSIANAGDGLLLGQPFYTRLNADPTLRAGATVIPVPFRGADPLGRECYQIYERVLDDAEARGQKVVGLLLCNPHNPLGRCYSRDALLGLLRFCNRRRIHVVADEIYALSVWDNKEDTDVARFESCLSLATEDVIDPALVHVVWGMSKDFGANGIRLGAIISQHNAALRASLVPVGILSSSSSLSDHVSANILEDEAWVDEYLAENRCKLAEHYGIVRDWMMENKIRYAHGVNAAFFVWMDLGAAYSDRHSGLSSEHLDGQVTRALLDKKVFLASGKNFGAEQPGWFRMVFSVPKHVLLEGLQRMLSALEE